jgi:hypothetical protein
LIRLSPVSCATLRGCGVFASHENCRRSSKRRMQICKARTPLHRLGNGRTLSHLRKGESQRYFVFFDPRSYPHRTGSFLSSTCRGIAPPLSPPPFHHSSRSSFPSVVWSWRARQLPDPVVAVGSSKGSDAEKRNRTGAIPLGAHPISWHCNSV